MYKSLNNHSPAAAHRHRRQIISLQIINKETKVSNDQFVFRISDLTAESFNKFVKIARKDFTNAFIKL